jgi:hypothetical protein
MDNENVASGINPRFCGYEGWGESRGNVFPAARGIALTVSVFKIVRGKRLAFRPIAGATVEIPVGIARATNGDVTPVGEKFCEISRKISKRIWAPS